MNNGEFISQLIWLETPKSTAKANRKKYHRICIASENGPGLSSDTLLWRGPHSWGESLVLWCSAEDSELFSFQWAVWVEQKRHRHFPGLKPLGSIFIRDDWSAFTDYRKWLLTGRINNTSGGRGPELIQKSLPSNSPAQLSGTRGFSLREMLLTHPFLFIRNEQPCNFEQQEIPNKHQKKWPFFSDKYFNMTLPKHDRQNQDVHRPCCGLRENSMLG